ncbi:MAG: hypothetical protein AAB262_11915 [Elusimicrobiota bacterium]
MWWDDVFSSGIDTGNFAVAESFGGPQEGQVADVFLATGSIPQWDEQNAQVNAALNSASADYDARLAADLQFIDAQSVNASLSSAGIDYAARFAADLAKIGTSALGVALNQSTPGIVAQRTGAAIFNPQLPRATRTATVSSSFNFSWQEAAIAAAVLFAGYKVARAL